MNQPKLKSCPFCGADAYFPSPLCLGDFVYAKCSKCGTEGPAPNGTWSKDNEHNQKLLKAAATGWNTRTGEK